MPTWSRFRRSPSCRSTARRLTTSRSWPSRPGYDARFAATRHFPLCEADGRLSGAGLFGNAILSRLPIRLAGTIGLPSAPDSAMIEPTGADDPLAGVRYADAPRSVREPRCMLRCELTLPGGGTLVAASTHLSHIGSAERRLQAEAVHAALDPAPGPTLLAGDFNAAIEADELTPLRQEWDDAFEATGVPAGDPRRRSCGLQAIDQLLTRGLETTDCRVVTEAGDASDHWPVRATMRVQ
jgi:endonuclease/exonuclease/phosphatase family metal-dependent hydrolase